MDSLKHTKYVSILMTLKFMLLKYFCYEVFAEPNQCNSKIQKESLHCIFWKLCGCSYGSHGDILGNAHL